MLATCPNLGAVKDVRLSLLSVAMDQSDARGMFAPSIVTSSDKYFSADFRKAFDVEQNTRDVDDQTHSSGVAIMDGLLNLADNEITDAAQTFAPAPAPDVLSAKQHKLPAQPYAQENDASGCDRSSVTERSRSEEEERKLVLASVKDVDCRDFPFDEVLSLEQAVKQEGSVTPNKVAIADYSTAEKMKSRTHSGGIDVQTQPISVLTSPFGISSARKTRVKPPMLRCSTWPEEEYLPDRLSTGNSSDSSSGSSVSKIDSPSFYSTAQIDFSAISHLSEEHDRLMAQERVETPQTQHPFISATTKEKLSAKAAKSRVQSQRRGSRVVSSRILATSTTSSNSTTSDFIVTHSKPQPFMGIVRRHTVSEVRGAALDNGNSENQKTAKTMMSPLEKAFRKRYSQATKNGALVSSLKALTDDSDSVDSLITNASAATDRSESSKKVALPMEKQPLPPEGFKITRYPIAAKATSLSPTTASTEAEVCKKTTPLAERDGSFDPQEIIASLRKKLEQAQERIAACEKQAKEWKEIAQQTLKAAQVLKAKMETEKSRVTPKDHQESKQHDVALMPLDDHQGFHSQRRWSNDVFVAGAKDATRARYISGDNLTPAVPMIRRSSPRGRKRSVSSSSNRDSATFEEKRLRKGNTARSEITLASGNNDGKNEQNLLDWLASAEHEASSISYVSMLESSPAAGADANTCIADNRGLLAPLPSRSFSHEEVRAALRAKVESSKLLTTTFAPQSTSLDIPSACQVTTSASVSGNEKQPTEVWNSLPDNNNLSTIVDWSVDSLSTVDDWINQTVPVHPSLKDAEAISDLLWSDDEKVDSPDDLSHSLSDSELHTTDKRVSLNTCLPKNDKPTLSKKLSNSGSWPNLNDPTLQYFSCNDINKSDKEFLKQLDSIFEL